MGDVAYDVLQRALPRVPDLNTIDGYDVGWGSDYVYVTLHRAELVDDPSLLRRVMIALSELRLPALFAVHPRTAAALERIGRQPGSFVQFRGPLGYLESIAVLRGGAAVVTDSGGVQREAYWLGVPCITVRAETEWIETLECGANRLAPPAVVERLPDAMKEATAAAAEPWNRTAYGDGTAAARIAAFLSKRFPVRASKSA